MIEQTESPDAVGLRLVLEHTNLVRIAMSFIIMNLQGRLLTHDQSKFLDEEKELRLGKQTLNNIPYNTLEYYQSLEKVKDGLMHHYRENDHHPEHYKNATVEEMSLLAQLEMLADWYSVCLEKDNDFMTVLNEQKERFNITDIVFNSLVQTAKELEWIK